MKSYTFNSRIKNVKPIPFPSDITTTSSIKNEPMLFNCDLEHALQYAGPITRHWLSNLPEDWIAVGETLVIDTRVHMLMPGWYPCIPGWHHDDIIRNPITGQPDYDSEYKTEHIITLVNSHTAPTKFALGTSSFIYPEDGKIVYGEWTKEVDKQIEDGILTVQDAPDQSLIHFDDHTWHTGVKAVENGWRWFGRVSKYYKNGIPASRGNARSNEIRRQVQVYLEDPTQGW
jgi:hypothetical protein